MGRPALNPHFWSGKIHSKSGPHLLVTASIRGRGWRELLFASLPSLTSKAQLSCCQDISLIVLEAPSLEVNVHWKLAKTFSLVDRTTIGLLNLFSETAIVEPARPQPISHSNKPPSNTYIFILSVLFLQGTWTNPGGKKKPLRDDNFLSSLQSWPGSIRKFSCYTWTSKAEVADFIGNQLSPVGQAGRQRLGPKVYLTTNLFPDF